MASYAPLSARRVLLESETADSISERFFQRLELPNGTNKNTVAKRFAELDTALIGALGTPRRVQVLDIAISSGTATLALVDSLEYAGYAVHATAIDLQITGRLKKYGAVDLLTHGESTVLQIAVGGLTLFRPSPVSRSRHAALGRALFAGAAAIARWLPSVESPVSFIAPAVRRRSNIALVEHDVFQPRSDWEGAFDVVRVCNLLSPRYFPDLLLRRAIRNCASWCRPDGMLVVCRTRLPDETNHATLFQRSGPNSELSFRTAGIVGEGSEVAAMVPGHESAPAQHQR